MGGAELLEKIRNIVLPVLDRLGYHVVEVVLVGSHGRRTLRVFIDRRGGVTLDDCARASKALSAELDQHDLLACKYYLEVSSPGAERKLRTREDFQCFVGRKAKIRFREDGGYVADLVGTIGSFKDDVLVLEPEGRAEVSVRFADILGANLSI